MKIAKVLDGDQPAWVVLSQDSQSIRTIEEPHADWGPRIAAGADADQLVLGPERPRSSAALLAPLRERARVFGAGATYAKHIDAIGLEMPSRPAMFLKTTESILDPDATIQYPEITTRLDYEGELVIVLGATVDRARPWASILGYTIGNDVTARDEQFSGGVTGMDMFSAKALDASTGLGPWIVTRDEFGDGQPDLELTVTVDGDVRQHDRTSSMVWSCAELVSWVDQRCRLRAGDVLYTGTCAGVGHEDGRYLQPGSVVTVEIERLGQLSNVVGVRPA
jgi:2-keto-4-pentenoate hydratase/2-oxohepta-3-ene-1,7-dioic acid hydratase in catechol pathway